MGRAGGPPVVAAGAHAAVTSSSQEWSVRLPEARMAFSAGGSATRRPDQVACCGLSVLGLTPSERFGTMTIVIVVVLLSAEGPVLRAFPCLTAHASRIPPWPAIAPIRIESGATSVPGKTMLSRSCAPSPIARAVAEHDRSHQAHAARRSARRGRSTPAPSTSASPGSGAPPADDHARRDLLALRSPGAARRAARRTCPAAARRASRRRSSTRRSRGCGTGRRSRAAPGRRPCAQSTNGRSGK